MTNQITFGLERLAMAIYKPRSDEHEKLWDTVNARVDGDAQARLVNGSLKFDHDSLFHKAKCLWNKRFGKIYTFKAPAKRHEQKLEAREHILHVLYKAYDVYQIDESVENLQKDEIIKAKREQRKPVNPYFDEHSYLTAYDVRLLEITIRNDILEKMNANPVKIEYRAPSLTSAEIESINAPYGHDLCDSLVN